MLQTSNFVYYLAAWSISVVMQDYPLIGRGQGHVTHIIILYPLKYLCIGYSYKVQILYTRWPREVLAFWWLNAPRWLGQGRMPHFYILGPRPYFGTDEAKYFKFGLQIERKEYWHYTCYLKFCSMGGAFRITWPPKILGSKC